MAIDRFISIGSRGTSIPPELHSINPPLNIGVNRLEKSRSWADHVGLKAHAWVSKNGEAFELYPLRDAVHQQRVRKIDRVKWVVQGKTYQGTAYLPNNWKPGTAVPQIVAVTADDYPHGRVESKNLGDRNKLVFGKIQLSPASGSSRVIKRKDWTRDELLVLMNVYEKLPFGQFDAGQPVIRDIAAKMDRTPGSIAMKLGNLASLDPVIRARGRKGLPGASELDRQVWAEFHDDRLILAPKSEDLFRSLFRAGEQEELDLVKGVGVRIRQSRSEGFETESMAEVLVRRGQQFFRQVILNTFAGECCITGIRVRDLLIASHILPWKGFPNQRLSPDNGLCLSRIHDGAFDKGLITFDENLKLVLSRDLKAHLSNSALHHNFKVYEGQKMNVPAGMLGPNQTALEYHRTEIFEKRNRSAATAQL